MATCGEVLVKLLEAYGVEQVFGIPGVHTVELYRGLAGSPINHVTPRHEQGAGFMADGYARTSGKPGVCFIITGPGMTNITTAMGQAYGDSIPMLVISSVQSRSQLGGGRGKLHEFNRLLRGATDTTFLPLLEAALPQATHVRHVVIMAGAASVPAATSCWSCSTARRRHSRTTARPSWPAAWVRCRRARCR